MGDGAALTDRIAERRAGVGDPGALVGELRRTLVLVPYDRGGLWTAEFGGVRWVCGFTDEAALARFAEERAVVEGRPGPPPGVGSTPRFAGPGCWMRSFRRWGCRPGSR